MLTNWISCSMPAVEYSKSFITSVVVGKDVVPRIGLHQMEALRADLINAIKRSVDPKVSAAGVRERQSGELLFANIVCLFAWLQWKTIACSVFCCGCGPEPTSVSEMSSKDANINAYEEVRLRIATLWPQGLSPDHHAGLSGPLEVSVSPLECQQRVVLSAGGKEKRRDCD